MTSNVLRLATEARKLALGPFSPSFNITRLIMEGLVDLLPEDVHLKVLFVAVDSFALKLSKYIR
jgi:hypothetical protein